MSFREKSAWVMAGVLVVAGAVYAFVVLSAAREAGATAPPPVIVAFVILVAVFATVGHIVIAALAPREAEAAVDERDRLIIARSGSLSGDVFAWGAVLSLGHYLVTGDGDALFHLVFASLIVAQIAEYALQIFFYRRSV